MSILAKSVLHGLLEQIFILNFEKKMAELSKNKADWEKERMCPTIFYLIHIKIP